MGIIQNDLVFDVGANHGEDTDFYLRKGFKCLSIEANPSISKLLQVRFKGAIDSGQLIVLNIGIWDKENEMTFYVNESNDHWSSFDINYGARNGTPFHTVNIKCYPIEYLLKKYGIPRYLKIDAEGADKIILQSLSKEEIIPPFISVEEYGLQSISDLMIAGYSHFKFFPQNDKSWASPPYPPIERKFVQKSFSGEDSGLFGLELPGNWLQYDYAIELFSREIRNESYEWVGRAGEWWDIHATL